MSLRGGLAQKKNKQRKEEEGKVPSILGKLIPLKEKSNMDIPLRKPEKKKKMLFSTCLWKAFYKVQGQTDHGNGHETSHSGTVK